MLPKLRSYAMRLTRNHNDADALVAETARRCLIGFHNWRGDKFWSWTGGAMLNAQRDFWKKAKKRPQEVSVDAPDFYYEGRDTESLFGAQDVFDRINNLMDLKSLVQRLKEIVPERFYRPFSLLISGMLYDDIATELGIPVGTVKSQINRARRIAKPLLAEYRGLN